MKPEISILAPLRRGFFIAEIPNELWMDRVMEGWHWSAPHFDRTVGIADKA